MMKTTTIIAQTKKGHRVFLEGTCSVGFAVGMPYSVTYEPLYIVVTLDPDNGKRKVAKGKGGVIDIESKKVTAWAQGCTTAIVVHKTERGRIIIARQGA